MTSRAARQRGGAHAGVRPLRPLPNPPGCACAVATRVFEGFSPVCVRPNQEEIYSRGPVKKITLREVRKRETGEGDRASRRGHLRFSSRECAVGFRRNLTKITLLLLAATCSHSPATPRFPGPLGRIRGFHSSALRAACRFCSSLPSQIVRVYTLAWSLALTGS